MSGPAQEVTAAYNTALALETGNFSDAEKQWLLKPFNP
jgi:hypothetical protein